MATPLTHALGRIIVHYVNVQENTYRRENAALRSRVFYLRWIGNEFAKNHKIKLKTGVGFLLVGFLAQAWATWLH